MSDEKEKLLASGQAILSDLHRVTVAFGEIADPAPEEAEAFIVVREELTARLEDLDARIGSSFAPAGGGSQEEFAAYLEHRNAVLRDVLARDSDIMRVARDRLAAISDEMAALQAGKQAMTGYRQGGLPGSYIDRTA